MRRGLATSDLNSALFHAPSDRLGLLNSSHIESDANNAKALL